MIEILTHWYAGRSQNELATSLGVDRKTLRKYTAPAVAAGMAPGGPPMDEADWRRLATEWFPQLIDHRLRQVSWPGIEPHRDYIAAQLKAGVTVATIHQRLRDEHGLDASVASVRRWVRANLPEQARRAQVTVLGDAPPPGRAGADRLRPAGDVARPRDGAAAGGVGVRDGPGVLAAPVRAPDAGDGPGRVDRRARGGVRVLRRRARPAGPGQPQDRGRPAGPLRPEDQPLVCRAGRPLRHPGRPGPRGQAQGQAAGGAADAVRARLVLARPGVHLAGRRCAPQRLRWSREVAGARACRPLDGAAPAAVFAAVEQPALRPLPAAPFVLATWSSARVGPDIHAKVGGTLYSLPWRFLGDRVDARSTPSMVQFFHHGQLIKTHPRKDRGKQTDLGDYPPEKIAFHMRTPTWCRHRAAEIGPACVAVIDGLLAENALFRLRAAQGVLGLADRHDPARLEAACATATAAGDPSYRTIKGILAAGTETRPAARPTGDGGAAAHLHGPQSLFADPITPPIAPPIAEVITLPVRADDAQDAS